MSYEEVGKLTKAYAECKDQFAVCVHCELIYVDDIRAYGALPCPECGLSLRRGISEENKIETEVNDFTP